MVLIQEGGIYTFCGYALNNNINITAVYLRIRWYESENGLWGELSTDTTDYSKWLINNDTNYQHLTVTGTAPPNAHSARVEGVLELNPTSTGLATAYFDDMSFEGPLPPTPTPTPTPTLTPTPTPTPTPTLTPTPTPTPTPVSYTHLTLPTILLV